MTQKNELQEDDFRPSAARLVESLRDTGYSEKAAFADIVDNAIAANATKISIELSYLMGDFRVVITDNGDGMTEEELKNAMRYGSEKRSNPKSLGKFGMGLKTASTAFCRRLVVLSQKNGTQAGRSWDLDTIREKDRWELETPDENDYYDDFEALKEFSGTSGTMIIWENIDRLIKPGSDKQALNQIKELGNALSSELSAVFFKYLASGIISISMKVADTPEIKLEGWDPLCSNLVTKDGVRSQLLKEKNIHVDFNGNKYSFSIKGSLIPTENDLTKQEKKSVRYGLDNQGFYIYREGRLIWNDGWPHRMYKKESKITRLRVELDFTHELDDIFSIDFRKSRVIIPIEIRNELKSLIAPWRQELLRTQSKTAIAKTERAHGPADNAIDKQKTHTKNSDIRVDGDTVTIRNENQIKPAVIKDIRVYDDKTVRVHEENSLLGDNLWEPSCDKEGNTCVTLGKSHPYFLRMYNVCKDNVEAIKALDMLLWSLANAEHGEYSETNQHTLKGLRYKVSQTLRYLSSELPDLDEDSE
ncbi:ATP-binding protein [Xenorhabdus anantnagensis]|uniref:ATP-binding protein n=1 Tax=Xenorhabdus anantnagensis TaxID=3025875 RepID=A0ABT5LW42_9GAMM|nr:ATP-binding protein [Xenorhabdus anantnagensis]MDC9597936.1 ATP-binding protein [Xenorhabdus anantnagensis]